MARDKVKAREQERLDEALKDTFPASDPVSFLQPSPSGRPAAAGRGAGTVQTMTDDEAWTLEKQFWSGGEAHYREAIDSACMMAFPAPTGIIAGPQIAQSLKEAPRWSSVELTDTHVARPARDLLVLAYKAEGRRPGADVYRAYCTSTYRNSNDRWRLVQHQQTPA